jgi:hypothetical protein
MKTRPSKRYANRTGGNPIVEKLLKLKYRIHDAYHNPKIPNSSVEKSDKDFVMGLLHNIRKREQNPSRIELEECNKIWRKYEG